MNPETIRALIEQGLPGSRADVRGDEAEFVGGGEGGGLAVEARHLTRARQGTQPPGNARQRGPDLHGRHCHQPLAGKLRLTAA